MNAGRKTGATHHIVAVLVCCVAATGCGRFFEFDQVASKPIRDDSVQRFRIGSSSMAPRLPGPRLSVVCGHCGQTSEIAFEDYREPALSRGHRCPLCGASIALRCEHGHKLRIAEPTNNETLNYACKICSEESSQCEYVSGAIVRAKLEALPQRWDRVLVRTSDHEQPLLKRILALPGESPAFKDGDLFLNGELFQKSLQELRRVSVPVTSLPRPIGKWQIEEEKVPPAELRDARIRMASGEKLLWQYAQPAPVHTHEEAPKDWLRTARVNDGLAENTATSTDLRFVDDFCLSVEFEKPISESVELECQIGVSLLKFVLVPPARSSRTQASAPNHFILQVADEATVAFCDGRVLASAIRNQSWTYSDSAISDAGITENPSSWFSIQCTGAVVLEKLELSRDLYFRSDAPRLSGGQAAMEKASLDTNGYFIVGDNLVVSQDSRNGLGRVQEDDILGVIEASE